MARHWTIRGSRFRIIRRNWRSWPKTNLILKTPPQPFHKQTKTPQTTTTITWSFLQAKTIMPDKIMGHVVMKLMEIVGSWLRVLQRTITPTKQSTPQITAAHYNPLSPKQSRCRPPQPPPSTPRSPSLPLPHRCRRAPRALRRRLLIRIPPPPPNPLPLRSPGAPPPQTTTTSNSILSDQRMRRWRCRIRGWVMRRT